MRTSPPIIMPEQICSLLFPRPRRPEPMRPSKLLTMPRAPPMQPSRRPMMQQLQQLLPSRPPTMHRTLRMLPVKPQQRQTQSSPAGHLTVRFPRPRRRRSSSRRPMWSPSMLPLRRRPPHTVSPSPRSITPTRPLSPPLTSTPQLLRRSSPWSPTTRISRLIIPPGQPSPRPSQPQPSRRLPLPNRRQMMPGLQPMLRRCRRMRHRAQLTGRLQKLRYLRRCLTRSMMTRFWI